jgi:hypothetical protein
MSANSNTLGESSAVASDASALVERAAGAADPARSTVGRITAAVSAVSLGVRALPAGLRLFRRYPLVSSLAVAGVIWAVVTARAQRDGGLSDSSCRHTILGDSLFSHSSSESSRLVMPLTLKVAIFTRGSQPTAARDSHE